MKTGLYKIVLFFNWVFIVLLILCTFAPVINPNTTIFFSVLGLGYPILVIINLLFSLFWILRKNWRLIYSLVVVTLLFLSGHNLIQYNSPEEGSDIKVISFNCKLLGLYDDNVFSDSLINYLNNSQADIICLQEFYNFKDGKTTILETFKKKLNYKHIQFMAKVEGNMTKQLGLLFISKHKITKSQRIPFKTVTSNLCMYADIEIGTKHVRIYNAHLQSLRLSRGDHKFIENPEQEEVVEKSKSLFRRMGIAFKIRAEQALEVKNHMRTSKIPTILCGDFNDTPISYCYKLLSNGLKDSYKEKGSGLGTTYVGNLPFLRIDYILHSKELKTTKYGSIKKFPSDHKVIINYLKFIDD